MIMDPPPQLILPAHYEANRPAIIRPGVDLARYFPVEIDRKTRRALVSELTKRDVVEDRREAAKLVEAAIPFGMFAAGSAPPVMTFITTAVDTSASITTSIAGVSIGAPSADRLVVVTLGLERAGAFTVTSASIGGITAAIVVQETSTGGNMLAGIISAVVPTGTTATISVTFSATPIRLHAGVWTITGLQSYTAANTNSTSTSGTTRTLTTSVVTPKDGVAIACYTTNDNNVATWTGDGVRQYSITASGNTGSSGGDATNTMGADATLSFTGTVSANSSGGSSMVAASFR